MSEAAFNLGLAYESLSQPAQAEVAYSQALQWRPDDFNAASNHGNLLRRSGRPREALPWLELARASSRGAPQPTAISRSC
jgi:Flp pilus assembly protein TadD